MKLCNVFALILFATTTERATSYSLQPLSRLGGAFALEPKNAFVLRGILDDYDASSSNDNGQGDKDIITSDDYDTLFTDIIFSLGDTRAAIADQLDACIDPGFLQFLETSMETSNDSEERQALQDLLVTIDTVKVEEAEKMKCAAADEKAQQQKQKDSAEEEAAQAREAATQNAPTERFSAADMLKKANQIDQAIMTAAAEAKEEEQPDNFMRDAKAVRGLAGFNNKGNMRVGGG